MVTAENFPNLGKETDSQAQEAQTALGKINRQRTTARHCGAETTKVRVGDYESNEGNATRYEQGNPPKTVADFSAKNFVGQKGEVHCNSSTERKRSTTKHTRPSCHLDLKQRQRALRASYRQKSSEPINQLYKKWSEVISSTLVGLSPN